MLACVADINHGSAECNHLHHAQILGWSCRCRVDFQCRLEHSHTNVMGNISMKSEKCCEEVPERPPVNSADVAPFEMVQPTDEGSGHILPPLICGDPSEEKRVVWR
ncbi:hypothetical protein Aduo_001532 [Ancylostoma duodenale]